MKHRKQEHKTVVVDGRQYFSATGDVVEQVAVGQHGAFGASGGSRGVDQNGQVADGAVNGMEIVVGWFSKGGKQLDVEAFQSRPCLGEPRQQLGISIFRY